MIPNRECPVRLSRAVNDYATEVLTLVVPFSVLDRVKDFLPRIEKVNGYDVVQNLIYIIESHMH